MRRGLVVHLLLVAATLAVFAQTVGFEFVSYDDERYVTENAPVKRGLTAGGVGWAFGSGTENWHPLTWLSHMLDVEIYGLDPAGHHATNVALHVLNALLLFGVLQTMTRATWRSAFVAALFAVHPLHVESVAWVSERKDVLSTAFGLLSLWAYVAYARRGGAGRYLLAASSLALGLMSKAMLVTLPLLFLLLDYWPLRRIRPAKGAPEPEDPACRPRSPRTLLLEKLPLLALSAAAGVITLLFQRGAGAVGSEQVLPVYLRAANAVVSYVIYLSKAFWPVDLCIHYPHPYVPGTGGTPFAEWQVAGAAALLLAISALAVRAKRAPYALVGWLWYLVGLLPAIGLIQVGTQGMADRYTYVPLIGIFIAITWGGADLAMRLGRRRGWILPVGRAAATAVLAASIACAFFQTRHWRDSEALFEHALSVTPNNSTIHLDLGFALQLRGRIDEAIHHYRRALEVKPDYALAHLNLGSALARRGELDLAIRHLRRALEITPEFPKAHSNLGSALRAQGRLDEAIDHYRHALRFRPDNALAHVNLGNALQARGEVGPAIRHYRRALEIEPDSIPARYHLGGALRVRGENDEAIAHYHRLLELRPEHADTHNHLGGVLRSLGQVDQAIEHYRLALRADPRHAQAHYNLGNALGSEGRLDEAIPHFRRALELRPDYTEADRNLTLALTLQAERAGSR
jgi:tetratricopeptide (TPR) repeat protein